MIYSFDLDNTLVTTEGNDYAASKPISNRIQDVNRLFDEGHTVILFTARGSASGKDHRKFTEDQMNRFGVKYHRIVFGKPAADIFIDDKSRNSSEWGTSVPNSRVVWTNGCFDVLHVGHIRLLKECIRNAAKHDARLVVAIDSDRRIRQTKGHGRPYNSEESRREFLLSLKGIDSVLTFDSDSELEALLKRASPEVMLVGEEYANKTVIGSTYSKSVLFFPLVEGHSTSSILRHEAKGDFLFS